jgi:hypothetical protein
MLTGLSLARPILALVARQTACTWSERGIATITAGFLALFATATTAATLTVASGDMNFDALGDVVESSVSRVSGTLEVRGSIIARSEDGASVSTIHVPIRLYGEGPAVSFDPAGPQRLAIAYYDATGYNPDVPYTAQIVTGNGDALLDPWETALLTIDLTSANLRGGEAFTLELSAPVGGAVIIQRRLPAILQSVISLY